MFKLVVGVGNPGPEYSETRHNIAWILLDSSPLFSHCLWKKKFKGEFCETTIKSREKVYALKPLTFMNLSGESVQPMTSFFKIKPSEILVLHDELDLPYGQVHFKMGGGLAGHNGLKSIAKHLGTDQFARMRIGIGRPSHGNVTGWVLGKFSGDQLIQLPVLMDKLNLALEEALKSGLKQVGIYNKKNLLA